MTRVRVLRSAVAVERAAGWRAEGRPARLVCGAFDVLAVAHARAVAAARDAAGRVLVAVWDDAEAARRLGAGRPLLAAGERARLAAALRGVDAVTVVDAAGLAALEAALGPGFDAERGAADPIARVRALRLPGAQP